MYRNIDVFVEQPDTHKSILCGACGVECAVERNKMGKQTFLGGPGPHDVFTCPNAEKNWHKEAVELAKERNESASPSIRKLIQGDIDRIVLAAKL